MGQKVHPLGFRLGEVEKYHSNWFIKPNLYQKYLFEDFIIRKNTQEYFKSSLISTLGDNDIFTLTDIKIYRRFGEILICVYGASITSLFVKNKNKNNMKSIPISSSTFTLFLTKKLREFYKETNNSKKLPKILLHTIDISSINLNAIFISKCLVHDLENRIPFRRALKTILRRIQKQKNILGIKIKVSGRLNGIEMARSEWVKKGRIPLQTFNACIEYYTDIAQTIYGILGIKVWIYKKN